MKTIICQKSNSEGINIIRFLIDPSEDDINKATKGQSYTEISESQLPNDRTFRDAWQLKEGVVSVDLPSAKAITHHKRRAVRSAELAPWDIKATIPSEDYDAEQERKKIRDKYAEIQISIDDADDIETLTSIHRDLG